MVSGGENEQKVEAITRIPAFPIQTARQEQSRSAHFRLTPCREKSERDQ